MKLPTIPKISLPLTMMATALFGCVPPGASNNTSSETGTGTSTATSTTWTGTKTATNSTTATATKSATATATSSVIATATATKSATATVTNSVTATATKTATATATNSITATATATKTATSTATSTVTASSSILHYSSGAGLSSSNTFPAGAYGFNLADVSSPSELSALPSGVKGLVWLGMCNGADSSFVSAVNSFAGNANLYGFYLMDEPDPTGQWNTLCSAQNLKAESDYIHSHIPGAKTFIVMMNMGSFNSPSFANTYTPANSGIDLFGIDPYPCRTTLNGCDFTYINRTVAAAEASGIPQSAIVPVYQTFGGGNWTDDLGGGYLMPNASQEQTILSAWAALAPSPAFDYAYAWVSQNGDTALGTSSALLSVFAAHNQPQGTTISAGGTNTQTNTATATATSSASATATQTNTASATATSTSTAASLGFKHVLIIALENTGYSEVLANPTFAAFAKSGALLTNYDAVAHPSEPNYVALTSGSTWGVADDNLRTYNVKNIADLLEAKGLSWKQYAEGYGNPSNCPNAYSPVDANHVPFLTYQDINTNLTRCHAHIVDASQLQADTNSGNLPSYMFYTPDINNDGHDTNVAYSANWFTATIQPLLKNPAFTKDTLVVVLYDEDDGGSNSNQVFIALWGSMVVPGSSSSVNYNHYSLLRTIEDNFNLGTLGANDSLANSIQGIWK